MPVCRRTFTREPCVAVSRGTRWGPGPLGREDRAGTALSARDAIRSGCFTWNTAARGRGAPVRRWVLRGSNARIEPIVVDSEEEGDPTRLPSTGRDCFTWNGHRVEESRNGRAGMLTGRSSSRAHSGIPIHDGDQDTDGSPSSRRAALHRTPHSLREGKATGSSGHRAVRCPMQRGRGTGTPRGRPCRIPGPPWRSAAPTDHSTPGWIEATGAGRGLEVPMEPGIARGTGSESARPSLVARASSRRRSVLSTSAEN
jgi:hypothetical protein